MDKTINCVPPPFFYGNSDIFIVLYYYYLGWIVCVLCVFYAHCVAKTPPLVRTASEFIIFVLKLDDDGLVN